MIDVVKEREIHELRRRKDEILRLIKQTQDREEDLNGELYEVEQELLKLEIEAFT